MKRQVQASVAILLVVAAAGLVWALVRGDAAGTALAAIVAAAEAVFGWWSLRRGRHVPLAQAEARMASGGRAMVLWKPGCPYCERLQRALRDREDVTWVNVWVDEEANRLVRRLNDGDEYTPTALVGERVLRNPTADQIREALAAR